MKKAIIVYCHNRTIILKEAIDSVRYAKDYDLFLWDNASHMKESIEFIKNLPNIKVLWKPDLVADECFRAIQDEFFGERGYDYIVMISDSSILVKGALEEMERVLYSRDDFAIATPVLSCGGPPESLTSFIHASQEFSDSCWRGDGIEAAKYYVNEDPLDWQTARELDGAVLAYKNTAWKRGIRHDPGFGYGWASSAEYGHRLRANHLQAVVARHAFCWNWVHHWRDTVPPAQQHIWGDTNISKWESDAYAYMNEHWGIGLTETFNLWASNFVPMSGARE